MPPKKQGQVPSKKTVEKKKEKVIEDKTFGIKNKKGKKQQTFIKQVTNQVKFGGGLSSAKREQDAYLQKKEKSQKEKEMMELQGLFKPVQQIQKISAGADPKSVLCLFFKEGSCTKGDKCKFSHDLSLENKAEKRSMYIDSREMELEEDTIDKWDTDKLNEVINKKHSTKVRTKTDIVCKHFLTAIEKGIYGWFWECPSGGDRCIYRHALPPGFVLKKLQKEQEDLQPQETITLEELVENERDTLIASGKALTKVTLSSFLAWKKRKLKEKTDKAQCAMDKRQEAFKQGKTLGISGREMFLFNPDLVMDEEEEEEGTILYMVRPEQEEDDSEVVDVSAVLAAIGDGDEVAAVKSEGETSPATEVLQVSDASQERGGAVGGASGEGISMIVDEGLFQEDFDDIPDHVLHDNAAISNNMAAVGDGQQVDIDESLFDVDDLQTLNLDDPVIRDPPNGSVLS